MGKADTTRPRRPRRRKARPYRMAVTATAWAALAAVAILAGWLHFQGNAPFVPLATPAAGGKATPGATSDAEADLRLRQLAIGTWQDSYHGRRTLTLRPDGTATMVIEFSGIKARLFTPRLRLDLTWSVRNGHMWRRITGGQPPAKVAFVVQRVGEVAVESIEALSAAQMQLRDVQTKQRYRWQRVR